MTKEYRELIKSLKTLNEKIDFLTVVTAINVGKESLFRGKEGIKEMDNKDKVAVLDGLGIKPDKIIALIIGSTEGSVTSFRYQRTQEKPSKAKPVEEESGNKLE